MSAAFRSMSLALWVALNPEARCCPTCNGSGKGPSVKASNCATCEGNGYLPKAHYLVAVKYEKQLEQDKRTKDRWRKLFPTAYAAATGEERDQ